MRKLNRSKLLGLVTAGAIVVTTAFSFAAWDKLEDKATASLKLNQPVTNELTGFTSLTAADVDLGTVASYSSNATFTIANLSDYTDTELVLDATVKEGATDLTNKFDITISQAGTPTENGLTNKVDTILTNSNEYTVTLTPNVSFSDTDITTYANGIKMLDVELIGTLGTSAP